MPHLSLSHGVPLTIDGCICMISLFARTVLAMQLLPVVHTFSFTPSSPLEEGWWVAESSDMGLQKSQKMLLETLFNRHPSKNRERNNQRRHESWLVSGSLRPSRDLELLQSSLRDSSCLALRCEVQATQSDDVHAVAATDATKPQLEDKYKLMCQFVEQSLQLNLDKT
eukprot:6443270-Amphidinium_carterae.1